VISGLIVEKQTLVASRRVEPEQQRKIETELDWKTNASICPVCGNAMFLLNGFHRCPECGYKESCCYL